MPIDVTQERNCFARLILLLFFLTLCRQKLRFELENRLSEIQWCSFVVDFFKTKNINAT